MSSVEENLEEINHKLDVIIENSFLSKLDLMFSVIMSLTIFMAGFMLNYALAKGGLILTYSVGVFALLTYTVVGQFWAIIKDDAGMRFRYWVAFVWGVVLLTTLGPSFAIPQSLVGFYFSISSIPLVIIVLFLIWQVDRLFFKYASKLRSRRLIEKAWPPVRYELAIITLILGFSLIIAYFVFVIR